MPVDLDAEERYLAALCQLGSKPSAAGGARRLGRLWLLASLLCAAWLVVSLTVVGPASRAAAPLLDLQDPAVLVAWLRATAVLGALRFAEFFLWGSLVSLAVGYARPARLPGGRQLAFAALLTLVVAAGLLFLGDLATPLAGGLLGLACLIGVWSGWSWSRGPAARFWLIPQFTLALTLTAGTAWQAGRLMLEPTPLAFPTVEVTSADKRHLVGLFRNAAEEDGFQRIRLAPHDLDLLLAWALSIDARGSRARLRLGDDSVILQACCPGRRGTYLNVQAGTRIRVEAGELEFRLLDLRIGRLPIPGWLLGAASGQIARWVVADPELGAVIGSIRSLTVQPEAVAMVMERQAARRRVRELLVRLGAPDQAAGTTRSYVEHLVEAAERLPDGEQKFAGLLQAAFALALRRSQNGDPVQENRAAIYALGMVTGHLYVEWAAGRVLDPVLRQAAARQIGRATVRGRADWVRHYSVSAALALWSSENASDAAGLLKEELDAGQGGSGFSFSDLLANRAGTTLALAATRDAAAARRVQQTLAGPWDIERVFPPAADLPEGLSDQQLQSQFGGVGGERYQQLVAEIENRVKQTLGGE